MLPPLPPPSLPDLLPAPDFTSEVWINTANFLALDQLRYWPTRYVLDKSGHIRFKHIGEGAYDETKSVIQALMAEPDPFE